MITSFGQERHVTKDERKESYPILDENDIDIARACHTRNHYSKYLRVGYL